MAAALHESRVLAPIQGVLLRRGPLTTLVSFLEALFADLIRSYYSRYPAALPQESHTLTLAEVKTLGSLANAETYILEKEAENVLRQSLSDQLKYFTTRLKVDLVPLEPYRDAIEEIWQRRNVVVHNNGMVNRIYLSRTPQAFVAKHEIKENVALRTSPEYLLAAIETVYLAGSILLHQCWTKWAPAQLNEAESHIVDQLFTLLTTDRFSEARSLGEYARGLKFSLERHRRIVLINLAIALKRISLANEVEEVLRSADWSAASLDFRVALHALRDEYDELARLLPRAIKAGDLRREQVDTWPLFADLRKHDRFEECLGVVEPEIATHSERDL